MRERTERERWEATGAPFSSTSGKGREQGNKSLATGILEKSAAKPVNFAAEAGTRKQPQGPKAYD